MDEEPVGEAVPRPLDYGRPTGGRADPTAPVGGQGALGCLTWVGAAGTWVAACVGSNGNTAVAWVAGGAILSGLVWLCVWVRVRHRWRGFLPGVLIGFGLTCLVPVGIVAVVCGPWHR